MHKLRDPDQGCPWDLEQSFASIAPFTIEEAYEVADAIARDDIAGLCDELGDLLFQVVFHSQLAKELGAFDFSQVVRGIVEKMTRRHPHVFGDEHVATAQDQTQAWEAHKEHERRAQQQNQADLISALDGIPVSLPALTRSMKLQKRAARVGFDWPSVAPVFDKVTEELDEVKQEVDSQASQDKIAAEIGDLLFAVCNLARHLNIDPESALRSSNQKFERRFKSIELSARQQDKTLSTMTLDEMEVLYQAVKRQERDD